jgi:hypothetical protein
MDFSRLHFRTQSSMLDRIERHGSISELLPPDSCDGSQILECTATVAATKASNQKSHDTT